MFIFMSTKTLFSKFSVEGGSNHGDGGDTSGEELGWFSGQWDDSSCGWSCVNHEWVLGPVLGSEVKL